MSERLLVSLCTYNERENLQPLVEEILATLPQAELLVVDDNSPDGTGDLAEELKKKWPQIHILHRPEKKGLGAAMCAALKYTVDNNYDYLINMDADFSHHPRHLPALFEGMENADVAIGSRYVKGGGVTGWGLKRYIMSWCINTYARWLLGISPKDCSGSYRCYRVSHLKEIDLTKVRSQGYAIQEELLYRFRVVGARFKEVPITFGDRKLGQSKIRTKDAIEAVWVIFRLAIDRITGVSVRKNKE